MICRNIILFYLILLLLSCKKNRCNDPSNPDCKNYDPCLFYPSASSNIQTFAYVNDLKVKCNEFLERERFLVENYYNSGDNFWELDGLLNNNFTERSVFPYFIDTGKHKILNKNIVIRKELCENGKYIDSSSIQVKIVNYRDSGSSIDKTKPLNKNLKWIGNFKGNCVDLTFNFKEIKLSRKQFDNGFNFAELEFTDDTCIDLYFIDKMGMNWFKSNLISTSKSNCSSNKIWFEEIYGIIDELNNITIIGINKRENYEFKFIGKKH